MQKDSTLELNISTMNKIGFQNFRRFQTFEPLEYKGITFLVGRNNAGKSTLVKALLLVDSYFKSGSIDKLSFGNSVLEDANIVTYGRAKNTKASENFIQFTQQVEDYEIRLTVSGEDDKSFAEVHALTVIDLRSKLQFDFNIENKSLTVTKEREEQINEETQSLISDLENQVTETKNQLAQPNLKKTSREYIELVSKLDVLENKLADILRANKPQAAEGDSILYSISQDFSELTLTKIVDEFISDSIKEYESEFIKVQNGDPASEKFKDLRAFKETDPYFPELSFGHFITLMGDFSIAYMGASPTKQSALFSIRATNNALAQAIHEYEQLNIKDGDEEHRFILKWMREFEVGDSFTITIRAGEAYEMKIHSNDVSIHLADKGMGSIQAMLLIMRVACIIKRIKIADEKSTVIRKIDGKEVRRDSSQYRLIDRTTVIIEEPELNLHPALQSKLADLFLDVHLRFKTDFLIETHSEYILRRSQVIVAENEYEVAPNENPFYVYYFPKDPNQQPYRLEYDTTGRFKQNFGDGFFDEATNSTMKLLKLQRTKEI